MTPDTWGGRFEELLRQWLAGLRSANTRAAYEADVRGFAAWCRARGRSPIDAATEDVAGYSADTTSAGASAATVARRLSALSSFYRHVVAAGALAHDPAAAVERPPSRRDAEPALSEDETARLLEAAAELGPKVRVLVGLLLLDGLKLGEALGLDIGDVAPAVGGGTATVRRQGASQAVPLDRRTAAAIDVYVGDRDAGPLLLGNSPTKAEPARLTRFGADFLLRHASFRAGLERRASAGVLRSSYISTARRDGASIDEIRCHVGHRRIRDTRRYVG